MITTAVRRALNIQPELIPMLYCIFLWESWLNQNAWQIRRDAKRWQAKHG